MGFEEVTMRLYTRPRLGEIVAIGFLLITVVPLLSAQQPGTRTTAQLELRLAESEPATGLVAARVTGSQQQVYLHRDVIATGADVVVARALSDATGVSYSVVVTFSQEGATRLAQATGAHLNLPLAILVYGQVVSAPTVRAQIGGSAVISGNFTGPQAAELVSSLNAR